MALTDDEKKLFDELTAKSKEPDASEDFEIEVYDTTKGKGARIPFSQGKNWLFDTFGIGENPNPPEEGEDKDKDKDTNVTTGYFGRKQPQKKTS